MAESDLQMLSGVSFAYPEVAEGVRAELVARAARRPAGARAFVLATCLRVEVAVAGDEDELERALVSTFGRVPRGGRRRSGEEEAIHLFRVAAGLESPVVGEIEVWTQFRKALAAAKEAALPGRLVKLLEQAVAAGRRARRLLPPSPKGSLASLAASVVGAAPRVAVLGSGEMAAAATDSLRLLDPPPEVVVVARSPEKAPDGVEAWPFHRAEEALASFPAVISATSAKRRLVPDEALARILAARRDPLVLVDLAMPPDFHPPPGARVRYLAIDALADLATATRATDEAEAAVAQAASLAWTRFPAKAAPVIAALYSNADLVVERAVERFAGRLSHPGDEEVLRQTAHTVARALLAGPVDRLSRSPEPSMAAAIADAFEVDWPDDG